MSRSTTTVNPSQKIQFDFLCVDAFVDRFIHARALKTAYQIGLIEDLAANPYLSFEALASRSKMDDRGLALLLDLLSSNHVIAYGGKNIRLSQRFRKVLPYSDLLQAKLEFSHMVTTDFSDRFTELLTDPARFFHSAKLFKLFGKVDFNPDNYLRTQRWMRITTCLTKYEAQAAMHFHDFSNYESLLDIGGNSGEFALQLCRRNTKLNAKVFDLPVVCDIGRRYAAAFPEAARIEYVGGTAFEDALPEGSDLITFKSMLHDWPERDAKHLLTRAIRVLAPGGTVLIYERCPISIEQTRVGYSLLPFLLFFRSFRPYSVYEQHLRSLGFNTIEVQIFDLDMPFFLLTARE